jgi:[acyl-carrier-protein] S-malonyltransferase
MGKDWFDSDSLARALFEKADTLLGFKLSELCFSGPEDELKQTKNTQPAIFLHSVIVATLVNNLGAQAAAGHSLGEYSALVAAGAISLEDGLRLVRLRGELMQEAGEMQKGTMAAIVGLGDDDLYAICREAASEGIVQPANLNSPGQIVISGSVPGVQKAMELARHRGAKLAKELVVSGAFHSPLMESAKDGLRKALDKTEIHDPAFPVYANVTAEPVTRAADIRDLLYRQLTSPVRWEQTVRRMVKDGFTRFCELGPGKVLQGLVKRTEPAVAVMGIDKMGDARTAMSSQLK